MNTITVRDLCLGDGIPKICIPIVAHTAAELDTALEALDPGLCDLAEFRADFYFEDEMQALAKIRKKMGSKPVIYTIRTMEEGGDIEIGQEEYEARNLAASEYADLADIQYRRLRAKERDADVHSRIVPMLQEKGVRVICSWHDFARTPSVQDMIRVMQGMQEEGCDIPKIAVMPQGRGDVVRLIAASVEMLEKHADRPFITMSMGNMGRITRAAGTLTGSCITFGMAGEGSAPGQIPAAELKRLLKSFS